ncbi:MAG TPA: hypothetical protein VLG47_01430 [Candidatus Saccharimonadales bacterium]|nr:hypothetical protein [Candidatus Saccharimonadales bacterium]
MSIETTKQDGRVHVSDRDVAWIADTLPFVVDSEGNPLNDPLVNMLALDCGLSEVDHWSLALPLTDEGRSLADRLSAASAKLTRRRTLGFMAVASAIGAGVGFVIGFGVGNLHHARPNSDVYKEQMAPHYSEKQEIGFGITMAAFFAFLGQQKSFKNRGKAAHRIASSMIASRLADGGRWQWLEVNGSETAIKSLPDKRVPTVLLWSSNGTDGILNSYIKHT